MEKVTLDKLEKILWMQLTYLEENEMHLTIWIKYLDFYF